LICPKRTILTPTSKKDFTSLSSAAEREFQIEFESCKFIIIDEFSMIGCSLMNMMDKRMRQAKPNFSHEPFGNVFVYLFGDVMQLPPVMDRSLYSDVSSNNPSANEGHLTYRSFQHCQILSINQRLLAGQSAEQQIFRGILDRISRGLSTQEDWCKLSSRFEMAVSVEDRQTFDTAVQLEPTREKVKLNNITKLMRLHQPIAKIAARHNNSTARLATEDLAQGLSPVLYLAVGSRVMLKSNLWVQQGLVNGAVGNIVDIVFAPNTDPLTHLPVCVLVKFDRYSGPCYHTSGAFPIVPILKAWLKDGIRCSRVNFPPVLAWSITVDKCQGLELSKAAINVGNKEMFAGITFVALSRVRSLNDLLLRPSFTFSRLSSISKMKAIHQRTAEETRFRSMPLPTIV
jgi:ATP-dependent exoDNAse (exonuclease V) alpha subunit